MPALPCLGQHWGPWLFSPRHHHTPLHMQASGTVTGEPLVRGSDGVSVWPPRCPATLLHPDPAAQEPPAPGEPLFPLDFPSTTDMCCTVPAQRPFGVHPDRGGQSGSTAAHPFSSGHCPFVPVPRDPSWGQPCPVPSPAARGAISPWPWLMAEVTVTLWLLCSGTGV